MAEQMFRPHGDVTVAVQVGNVAVSLTAGEAAWAPDIVNDMKNRTIEILASALIMATEHGVVMTYGDADYEDDESEDGE